MSTNSINERYRITAQAIGLMELLGNEKPNSQQIRLVEKMVLKLHLPWDACENLRELVRALRH